MGRVVADGSIFGFTGGHLGLVCHLHRGQIVVTSQPSEGTLFRITIPRDREGPISEG